MQLITSVQARSEIRGNTMTDSLPSKTALYDRYQEQLETLIASHPDLVRACNCEASEPTNPFLLGLTDEYLNADIRVMFIGQETRGWLNEKPFPTCNDYSELIALHELGYPSAIPKWGKPVRRAAEMMVGAISQRVAEQRNRPGFVWNNLIKVGKHQEIGKPCQHILDWQADWFVLLREEIETFCKPNLIIFLTGPNYDSLIKRTFPDVTFGSINGYRLREMAALDSSCFHDACAIRTYHPGYLNRGKGRMQRYLSDLVDMLLDQQADQYSP